MSLCWWIGSDWSVSGSLWPLTNAVSATDATPILDAIGHRSVTDRVSRWRAVSKPSFS